MLSPPNKYNCLTIHDVKLFARLVLDVGAVISRFFDPGDDQLIETVPLNLWAHIKHDKQRYRNKILGYLRTEFGLEANRAEKIVSQLTAF